MDKPKWYRGGTVTAALAEIAAERNIPAIDRFEDPEGDKRVEQAITRKNFKPGSTMTAESDGRNYTIRRVNEARGTLTLERTIPKEAKGKAAKKAAKKARRLAREANQQKEPHDVIHE